MLDAVGFLWYYLLYSTLLYDCMTGLVEPVVIVEPLNWHPRGGCVPLGGAVCLRASHPPSLTRVADQSSLEHLKFAGPTLGLVEVPRVLGVTQTAHLPTWFISPRKPISVFRQEQALHVGARSGDLYVMGLSPCLCRGGSSRY